MRKGTHLASLREICGRVILHRSSLTAQRIQPMTWAPSLGAWLNAQGTYFRVWATTGKVVHVVREGAGKSGTHPLLPDSSSPATSEQPGCWEALVPGVRAGDRYRFLIDGKGPFPDPASRFQPDGVHGPSEVVDATKFDWTDSNWSGITLDELVIYELHVGAFTPVGTFAAVIDHLQELAALGVTAIELMPVADFPGRRNWGYDGVDLFAPARR